MGVARLDFKLTRLYPSRAKTAFFVSIMLLLVVSVPQNHLKLSNKSKSLLHKAKDNRLEKMQVRGFKVRLSCPCKHSKTILNGHLSRSSQFLVDALKYQSYVGLVCNGTPPGHLGSLHEFGL